MTGEEGAAPALQAPQCNGAAPARPERWISSPGGVCGSDLAPGTFFLSAEGSSPRFHPIPSHWHRAIHQSRHNFSTHIQLSHLPQSLLSASPFPPSTYANMGNGAKAAMKRDRNASEKKGGGSQLDANAKAMDKQCKKCMQTFLTTTSKKVRSSGGGLAGRTAMPCTVDRTDGPPPSSAFPLVGSRRARWKARHDWQGRFRRGRLQCLEGRQGTEIDSSRLTLVPTPAIRVTTLHALSLLSHLSFASVQIPAHHIDTLLSSLLDQKGAPMAQQDGRP